MKNNLSKGFTLIELLLVVGIVTVLSSLFMFNATEAKKKAEDSHMASESHEVQNAINMYKDQNNGFVPYNATIATGGKVYLENDPKYDMLLAPLVDQNLISKIPHSPNGKSYAYGFSTDYKQAVFVANLNVGPRSGRVHNSCTFIKQDVDIRWDSGVNIIKSDSGLATAYCENNNYPYYCFYFNGLDDGKSLLKSLCMEDAFSEEYCTNLTNFRFDLLYENGKDMIFVELMNNVPKVSCNGTTLTDYCMCL